MIKIGIDNIAIFQGGTRVKRLSDDLFNNYFQSCSDKTEE